MNINEPTHGERTSIFQMGSSENVGTNIEKGYMLGPMV